jgi:hypothetical protein
MRRQVAAVFTVVLGIVAACGRPTTALPDLVVPADAVIDGVPIDVAIEVPGEDLDRSPGVSMVLPTLQVPEPAPRPHSETEMSTTMGSPSSSSARMPARRSATLFDAESSAVPSAV